MCMTTLNPVGVHGSQYYTRTKYNRSSGLIRSYLRVVMEEQRVGKKAEQDCIEVPDKVLEGDVETDKILKRGMDEGEVLEGTMDVRKDQTKVLEDCVYMDEDQVLEGVEVDTFQYEVPESSNEVGKVQDEVLDGSIDVVKVLAVVLEGCFDNEMSQDKVLEDGVDVDKVLNSSLDTDKVQDNVTEGGVEDNTFQDFKKVLDGGVEVNKDLEGGLDMDKVQDKVLKVGVEVDKFQDKVLKGGVGLNTAEDNFVKGNVDVDEIHDKVQEGSVYVENVLEEAREEAEDMDKVRNKMKDGVDVDKTLGEGLKGSVDVNKNSVDLNKPHDMVLEDNVDMEEVLNTQERMDTMRCQVKITTRHSLQLRMVNHTAQDVFVRLLSHGERIAGSGKEAYFSDYDNNDHDDNPINILLVTSPLSVDLS
ncbi:uncharacterized protein LOC128632834 [Ictalurus punctatus]|uniref:Uncharacterized protein LOC128632834 n=1 Tax=Ictalurus punctatus TaxID=7998 RepID=A0A9F7R4L6_ICTPU|nr:uncharacterized protein LOC128632834 [Ictalurus punctatus]